MPRFLVSCCATLLMVGSAVAADIPARSRVSSPVMAPSPYYNWNGFYIGGHVGYGWGSKDIVDGPSVLTNFSGIAGTPLANYDVDGAIGGGQIGWNWQAGHWLFDIEADISASGMKGSGPVSILAVPLVGVAASTDINFLATVTGRFGYAWNNWLWYAKGGWAYVDEDHSATAFGALFTTGDSRSGWTVGTGIEWGFANNWSAKVEYNYMDFGDKDITLTNAVFGSAVVNVDQQIHAIKFGINYRFGRPY